MPAIKVSDAVLPIGIALSAAGGSVGFSTASVKDILGHWDEAEPVLGGLANAYAAGTSQELHAAARPLASVRLLAPILYPDAIFCAFANYTDHMMEMSGRDLPTRARSSRCSSSSSPPMR